MAESEASPFQYLKDLEDELTCSICLCPFQCPVTIPCGHNFCQDCLIATWKESYDCPQCRAHFTTKPELKKNTVLSTVMKTFGFEKKEEVVKESIVLCDTCMASAAVKTCLTCMASFCLEHVRPHHDNPNYRAHQLTEPLADMSERICPDHHKLMEFFCVQHSRSICSFCLQQVHKGCPFSTPDEQKRLKESDCKSKLVLLDSKIEKTQTIISQITEAHNKLKESVTNRKKMLETEYQQIREMLDREERDAMNTVDRQLQSGETKYSNATKRFFQNIQHMESAKRAIGDLLSQSDSLAFLQSSVDLPSVVNAECNTPRVTLDSKDVIGAQTFVVVLKDYLCDLLKQPVENRPAMLKPGDVPKVYDPSQSHAKSSSPGPSWGPGLPGPKAHTKKPNKEKGGKKMKAAHSVENVLTVDKRDQSRGRKPEQKSTENPETSSILPSLTFNVTRHELLKYATVLTLDRKTAHRRVKLSEDLTGASVMDEPANYPDCPARFSVCSQVLTSKGFSRGRHYWEVKMSSNNYMGIGLAYKSMDRKGPSSRLGRNAQSWCVEWLTLKLSAWHDNSETVLESLSAKRVGVLVDCDEGTATFYGITERLNPFHTFVFPFTEAVYPAFWIFSNASSVSLCKLQS
ncbi:unnamed protein product [Lota lota]